MITAKLVQKAEFSPTIKTYILLVVAFFLLISFIGIPILILWFFGIGQYMSKRYYQNLSCELKDRHLEFKKGVLFKVEKTIPLENIQDLTFIENPLLKWLKLRVIKIETAGSSNAQGADMKLIGIINPVEFKENVLNQREKLILEKRSGNVPASSDNQSIELLTEIRDLLIEIKEK